MLNRFEKALVVCSETCNEVEACLVATGCKTVKVENGTDAVSRARRETFDAAVLISTGRDMDITETVLNLRDITKTMKILVLIGGVMEDEEPVRIAARALPDTRIVNLEELKQFIGVGAR